MFGFALNISNRAVFGSGVPVAVAATTVTDTSFVANWNAYPNAIYYLLDVSLTNNFSSYVIQNQPVYDTFFTVTGLIPNTTYYYRVRAELKYDTDAQAFFDRITNDGWSISTTEKQAVNALTLDLKYNNLWSKMKAIYPMVGASSISCKMNLKSSSFTGAFSSGWTYASTGVTPNGTSAYMETNMNQSANLSNDSVHLSYYSRTSSTPGSFDIGGNSGAPNYQGAQLAAYYGGIGAIGHLHSYPTDSVVSTATTDTRAFYLASRTSSTSNKIFRNSTLLNTSTTSRTSTLANVSFRLATDYSGFTNRECAFASIGDGLTDSESNRFYTIVQSFQTRLARQIGAPIVADSDAQAFINRVYTAGGTVSATEATAVNKLVGNLKAANLWNSMKAIYPMVGASAAACAQNLRSASFTGSFSTGWTFSSSGVTGNGVSAYMDTNFIPSNNYASSTNFGLFLYTSSITAGAGERDLAIFTGGATPSLSLTSNDGTSSKADLFDYAGRISVTGYNVEGFYVGSRTASNSAKLYRNGTSIGSTTASPGTAPSISLYLGKANGASVYSAKTFSFVGTCDGLSDTEASKFYTVVQEFQTTLSRQV